MACYEKYHWTPETIRALPLSEAYRLAIYFEEESRHTRKKASEAKSAPSASGFDRPGVHSRTVMELSDDNEEYLFEENEDD